MHHANQRPKYRRAQGQVETWHPLQNPDHYPRKPFLALLPMLFPDRRPAGRRGVADGRPAAGRSRPAAAATGRLGIGLLAARVGPVPVARRLDKSPTGCCKPVAGSIPAANSWAIRRCSLAARAACTKAGRGSSRGSGVGERRGAGVAVRSRAAVWGTRSRRSQLRQAGSQFLMTGGKNATVVHAAVTSPRAVRKSTLGHLDDEAVRARLHTEGRQLGQDDVGA